MTIEIVEKEKIYIRDIHGKVVVVIDQRLSIDSCDGFISSYVKVTANSGVEVVKERW